MFSSVGLERYLDRVEVGGSNPSTPTEVHRDCEPFFVSPTELLLNFYTNSSLFTISILHHRKDMSNICFTCLITQTKHKKRVGFQICSKNMENKMHNSDRIVPPQLFI